MDISKSNYDKLNKELLDGVWVKDLSQEGEALYVRKLGRRVHSSTVDNGTAIRERVAYIVGKSLGINVVETLIREEEKLNKDNCCDCDYMDTEDCDGDDCECLYSEKYLVSLSKYFGEEDYDIENIIYLQDRIISEPTDTLYSSIVNRYPELEDNYFTPMMILDYITNNIDRHGDNIKVLVNKKTGDLRIPPLFDNERSLTGVLTESEKKKIIELARNMDKRSILDILDSKNCNNYFNTSNAENLDYILNSKAKDIIKNIDTREIIYLVKKELDLYKNYISKRDGLVICIILIIKIEFLKERVKE